MTDLTDRQKQILALVIRDYIETAQPVGSQRLVEVYNLNVSSATVRNELSALTEMGYLRQPHTSAGRVPSEEGYRYFVGQLMGNTDLPMPTKRMIIHQFYQAGTDIERWMRLAASVLAHQSQGASLVTAPHSEMPIYKHVELISTRGRQVLMVLVMANGEIRQQMLTLAEPITQEQLSTVAQHLNSLYQGLNIAGIQAASSQLEALEQDITKLISDVLHQSSNILGGEVYRDGINQVLGEPEFSEVGTARRALRILEERPLLEDLLSRTLLSTELGGVQVLIGGEGTYEELRDCSFVLARYGHPALATGTLGVLGPIRMPYGRTISTVRFVANLLSDLVVDLHTE
jgi:heat-inducible transcriptional repressor